MVLLNKRNQQNMTIGLTIIIERICLMVRNFRTKKICIFSDLDHRNHSKLAISVRIGQDESAFVIESAWIKNFHVYRKAKAVKAFLRIIAQ